jgi:hypothetical protein
MHYEDGTEVKIGDVARSKTKEGVTHNTEIIGIVVGGQPQADTCNINVVPTAHRYVTPAGVGPWLVGGPSGNYAYTCTAKECVKVA